MTNIDSRIELGEAMDHPVALTAAQQYTCWLLC